MSELLCLLSEIKVRYTNGTATRLEVERTVLREIYSVVT